MNALSRLLEKVGIANINDLSSEEKATYENYEKVLSKEELTLEDVKEFCRVQVGKIEEKWRDLNIESFKKEDLIPYHTVWKSILLAIESPKVVRESLEKQLTELINDRR